jgi:MFS transporter, OFA family, oxalate/formate antiporter
MTTILASESDNLDCNRKRWRQLILGVVCMAMIANLQYGWTLFVVPLHQAQGWTLAAIQVAFTLFVALETWTTPLNGWIADKLGPDWGPRVVISAGGALVALGWTTVSMANSLPVLYFGNAVAGLGGGAVYVTCLGLAAKWFKDKRGLAVGLVAAGFGGGAALTVIPVREVIDAEGYRFAFLLFALIQGGVCLLAAQFMRNPHPGEAPAVKAIMVKQTGYSYSPSEMLRQPMFWVLYILNFIVLAAGFTVAANLASLAHSYGVADVAIWGTTALSVGLIFANISDAVGRPFFGWVGDRIGRPPAMAIAFAIGAASYYLMSVAGHHLFGFIFFIGIIFACWGAIFSLFPSMCTDLFGQQYATTNLGFLYTSKGAASFMVPLGTYLVTVTDSWNSVLFLAAGLYVLGIIVALALLRPAEHRHHTDEQGHAERVGRPSGTGTETKTTRQPSANRPNFHDAA